MRLSVIVPTYNRTTDLLNCLGGLQQQSRVPDEVIIVIRITDNATREAIKSQSYPLINITIAEVEKPGQVAALNAGLEKSTGDIIAITDDDTIPRKQWLYLIEKWFLSDPRIGGVGGRDWVFNNGKVNEGIKMKVGKVSWFGRVIGNHHLGGKQIEVDVLKGANMSYRREAIQSIRFDHRLKGNGAQVHNDMAFSLAVKKDGWKLIYDPLVAVDHYPATRHDLDQRNEFNAVAQYNQSFNETFTLKLYLGPVKGTAFLIWALLIGSSSTPGFLQVCLLYTSDAADEATLV